MGVRSLKLLKDALFASDAPKRYEGRFHLLDAVARKLGFQLYNKSLGWVDDADYLAAWRQFRPGASDVKDRKFVLYSMARSVAQLPGDTAECGVFEGGSSFLICLTHDPAAGTRHHVFDSFEGLSEPESLDVPGDPTAFHWKKNDLAVPIETVRQNLARFDNVDFHPGWIPDGFDAVAERQFRFVHIDVDLHQPTHDSIAFFYERMVPGGILLCDDYGFTTCPGAKRAFDEFVADRPERTVIHLATGQGFIVKR